MYKIIIFLSCLKNLLKNSFNCVIYKHTVGDDLIVSLISEDGGTGRRARLRI